MSQMAERFFAKVDRSAGDDACWEWTGSLTHNGYGIFTLFHGKPIRAHRFSAAYHGNPIPRGLVTDHLCRNRKCVNPKHLEAVTIQENTRRGDWSPNIRRAQFAKQTHCKHGHPFDEENTYHRKSGSRTCKECCRKSVRVSRARRRAASLSNPTEHSYLAAD